MTNLQGFKCRKTILELLKRQEFDTSGYENFSMNEVNIMSSTNQLDMLMQSLPSARVQRKVYVRFVLDRATSPRNIQDMIEDLFVQSETLTKNDLLYIITREGMKQIFISELTRNWERDGWLVIVEGIKNLQFNILEHELVPAHRIMTDDEVDKLKKKYNIIKDQLPEISRFDPVARAIGLRPGQICHISRPSKTSIVDDFYRLCV
jgi:DNA-directed RNA polymerase subunit H (RpoH/RPB5)